jgi:hypothetical protein
MEKLNLSNVVYSRRDIEKGIVIPEVLTPKLSEDIGIHLGDGSLYLAGSCKTFEFIYSGHIDEKSHMTHIMNLKRELYNIQKGTLRQKGNELRLRIYSFALANFYTKVIGLPIGTKKDICVPNIIMVSNNKEIIAGFLRGLIDTDFSLIIRKRSNGPYPSLQGDFSSKNLIIDLQKLFIKLNIQNSILLDIKRYDKRSSKTYISHTISIHGFKRVTKWLEIIGYNNKKKFKKKVGLAGFEPSTSGWLRYS